MEINPKICYTPNATLLQGSHLVLLHFSMKISIQKLHFSIEIEALKLHFSIKKTVVIVAA